MLALPGILYLTTSCFSFLTLVAHSYLHFAHCYVLVQAFVNYVVNQMEEFIWLKNNPANNHVAAQMFFWPAGEDSRGRTVYGSVKADYGSFFDTGADLTCRNTILVFLGCIYKIKVVRTSAAHDNGS